MENTTISEESKEQILNLPIGFRFHPTDEELVLHYLKRKVFSAPLPAAIIPTFQIFRSNPWDLPGELNEARYFFSKRKVNGLTSRDSSSDCGYWKWTDRRERQVWAPGTDLVIGLRRSYAFYQGKKPGGLKTHWAMHEFCLVGSVSPPCLPQKIMMQVGDWVVCRVYQKRRKRRNHRRRKTTNGGEESGFTLPQTTSSCDSVVTEICSDTRMRKQVVVHNRNISWCLFILS